MLTSARTSIRVGCSDWPSPGRASSSDAGSIALAAYPASATAFDSWLSVNVLSRYLTLADSITSDTSARTTPGTDSRAAVTVFTQAAQVMRSTFSWTVVVPWSAEFCMELTENRAFSVTLILNGGYLVRFFPTRAVHHLTTRPFCVNLKSIEVSAVNNQGAMQPPILKVEPLCAGRFVARVRMISHMCNGKSAV